MTPQEVGHIVRTLNTVRTHGQISPQSLEILTHLVEYIQEHCEHDLIDVGDEDHTRQVCIVCGWPKIPAVKTEDENTPF